MYVLVSVFLCYRLIRALFCHARQQTNCPVIVFMDEVDSVCRQRSVKEEDHSRRVKTELLCQVCLCYNDTVMLQQSLV